MAVERGDRRDGERAGGPVGWGTGTDLLLAGFLYLVTTVAFRSWYSAPLADRAAFEPWYADGVYGPRLLGTRLALWLESVVGNPIGDHLVVSGRYPLDGDMSTALLLLNGAAMAALAVLVGAVARGRRGAAGVGDTGSALVTTVLLAVVAASLSTVTPYDLLSLACLLGVLVLAVARPPLDLLAVPLVAVGVLTRESALVAVAALVAVVAVDRRRGLPAGTPRPRPAVVAAVAVAGVVAYAVPRLTDGGATVWAAWSLPGNVGRLAGWLGLALLVAAYLVWGRAWSVRGRGTPPTVAWCWCLAAPYVAVAALTGYWFELRLLVPLLVAELWLRATWVSDTSAAPATA